MQFGFVVGALCSAALGLADRFDPRRVFCTSAIAAALVNAALLAAPPGGLVAIAARIATGALHVGVYPVGMKIAVGWGVNDRGFLVGAFVGAFTLGSASLHLLAFIGRVDWRVSVAAASMIAGAGGFIALTSALGPHHALAQHFDRRAVSEVWTNRRVWLTNAGYLGHMWELYAMWAWIAAANRGVLRHVIAAKPNGALAKLTAFLSIAAGVSPA